MRLVVAVVPWLGATTTASALAGASRWWWAQGARMGQQVDTAGLLPQPPWLQEVAAAGVMPTRALEVFPV